MLKKLSPSFIELTQDACLKAFWRKRALRAFLKQHQISDNQLASWAEDESKRDFLARLFDALIGVKDNRGFAVILNMARSLAEMKHFPDLENWEDSSEKISNAHKAIARLKSQVDKLNEQVRDENESREWRKRAAEDRERQVASQKTLLSLEEELKQLLPRVGTQEGGYAFEEWFYKLVAYAEMVARRPYKDPNGRQIDGSVTLDGTTFLVEVKFTVDPIGSQDIDILLSKIARKADNTMGIMISLAGFNENAIKNASRDRTPLLLMDYSHIFNVILPGIMPLPEVIQRIWRHASQTGESYLSVTNFSG
ncbi:MAG: restriction endonuclease [Desulfofustis sp. PB-SRB1]|nr:restriction endonuclease [Desulfofustis sp. PB-SRB1]